ncbi:hypothetical protein CEUSTIGMA_g1824.t1 [Chlamydomonas eustigma]|uniref:Uncharacterized protein n=1 Tax=Chlamydomonas eustigma TaxID=1157962 RepID=A0A250WUD9_9CHLO|nr:hypothetical protein CEUSTIGMA_g1824.t1 [Chlamydomonas eustigma]|eukprot:GAX74376.1 hypothetical protein CEUSTIGMA_g1824.t1 [Chlamydomonas eustigma]
MMERYAAAIRTLLICCIRQEVVEVESAAEALGAPARSPTPPPSAHRDATPQQAADAALLEAGITIPAAPPAATFPAPTAPSHPPSSADSRIRDPQQSHHHHPQQSHHHDRGLRLAAQYTQWLIYGLERILYQVINDQGRLEQVLASSSSSYSSSTTTSLTLELQTVTANMVSIPADSDTSSDERLPDGLLFDTTANNTASPSRAAAAAATAMADCADDSMTSSSDDVSAATAAAGARLPATTAYTAASAAAVNDLWLHLLNCNTATAAASCGSSRCSAARTVLYHRLQCKDTKCWFCRSVCGDCFIPPPREIADAASTASTAGAASDHQQGLRQQQDDAHDDVAATSSVTTDDVTSATLSATLLSAIADVKSIDSAAVTVHDAVAGLMTAPANTTSNAVEARLLISSDDSSLPSCLSPLSSIMAGGTASGTGR